MRLLTPSLILALAFASPCHALRMADAPTTCTVSTSAYTLRLDVTQRPFVRILTPDGKHDLARFGYVYLDQGGRRYDDSAASLPAPHFHPLREGPYLAELHIENIILSAGGDTWPGLAELSIYCHEDRVFVVATFLCANMQWINRGLYVYQAPADHRSCPAVSPTACGFDVSDYSSAAGPAIALRATTSGAKLASLLSALPATAIESRPTDTPWQPGSTHDVGVVIAPGATHDAAHGLLDAEAHPLPASAFSMQMGKCLGYDPTRGVYALTARTSGTPNPPRGLIAGTRFQVHNDARPRTILIDQRDPWGGIAGGMIRNGAGLPLPILVQFGLNYPEHNADAGEPGWAILTYPLTLAANQVREIHAEHYYHALTDCEVLYLNSLENIGDPLLLQVTVGRGESHTLTTGPYPGALKPGNELRINDFRRIYSQEKLRSVSAILPTFFGYWDAAGQYQGLMPGFVTFHDTSPFLADYTVDCATRDGAVSGTLHVWQAPFSDMTRVFTDVNLRVNKTVSLDPNHVAPLFFLRHHAFNPMAYMRYAYTGPDGKPVDGALSYSRTVVKNGSPMGELPFACLYRASNGLDQNVPCSDITGNPGFVVLDWNVRFGGRAIHPGAYVFCTGANDKPDGSYARDMAIVPTEKLTQIPAGSTIHYRAVQIVTGDNSTDWHDFNRERTAWALHPLAATAKVGTVVSSDPPEFRAAGGKLDATVTGGTNWIPVRIEGMDPTKPLHLRQTDATGKRELGPGKPGEPWYDAWPDGAPGTCGFTILIHLPASGPVRLEAWQ